MPIVREPGDLAKKIREKYIRNSEYIKSAVGFCKKLNSKTRLLGPLNLIMLSKQYKRANHELVLDKNGKGLHSQYRWIRPEKEGKNGYYKKHHEACFAVPKDCAYISLTFSAEDSEFHGGSIRVRFYKEKYIQIFTKTIILPQNLLLNCWEYKVPKEAVYYSVSFKLHTVKDETAKVAPRKMILRSATTKNRDIL